MGSAISRKYNENFYQTIRDLDAENKELKKQINSLKNINTMKHVSKKSVPEYNKKTIINPSDISKDKINEYVDKLLLTGANSKYLPDFVEKQLYQNIITLGIQILDDMLNTTSIKFVGHEITFDLRVDDSNENTEKEL
jgi:cell division septum initiation protein DivIVA